MKPFMDRSKVHPVIHQRMQAGPSHAAAIASKLEQALGFHRQGQLVQAVSLYREIIKQAPSHFDALHLLGVAEFQASRHDEVHPVIHQRMQAGPAHAAAIASKLGQALGFHRQGQLVQAVSLYREIIKQAPRHFDALHLLGVAEFQAGRHELAVQSITHALEINPESALAHSNLGNALLSLARPQEALACYDRALAIGPPSAEMLSNRGSALQALKRQEESLASYDRALVIESGNADALSNRGSVLLDLDRAEDALNSFDRALAIRPDYPEALYNRGNALMALGRVEEALASYDRSIAIRPELAQAHLNRGRALQDLARPEEALASYDRVLAIHPDYAEAHYNRGNALMYLYQYEQAFASFDMAVTINPDHAEALCGRGLALIGLIRQDEALASLDRALALRPDFPEALLNRGNALQALQRHDEALESLDKALEIKPDFPNALVNRASFLLSMRRYEEAVDSCERAIAIDPGHANAQSNRVYFLDFVPELGFAEHQAARRTWYRALAKDLCTGVSPYIKDADPRRRLIVGYVSADFVQHSAASCFGPVLRHHDHSNFEVVCYSGVIREDDKTREFRQLAGKWRSTAGLSDEALAEQIRADGIDILVDLSGHTAGNRLLVFARKPAPIQVTAWGSGTGTGLPAIDYLFSDPVAIPVAVRALFAETVYDLPCPTTMEAPADAPPVAELPVLSRGVITFGCLNRFSKISPAALELWARILQAVPGSRLLLKDKALNNPIIQARVRDTLARLGIVAERIELRGGSSHKDHLGTYNDVDIALDPFPQNGGITTWESMWMGVPVVAKLGNSVPSRISGSILHAVGLSEWVAEDDEQYAGLAIRHAGDLDALAQLRGECRARITASAAGNVETYTRAVEQAYRSMWNRRLTTGN
jgi:predicted O-linked N-acetylglucosamine transferase (SPINDLY family)